MSSPTVIIEGLVFRHHAGATGDGGFEVRLDAFRLAPGELVALVGPSGCGKSTLLDLIGLILAPQALTRYTLRPPGETPLDLADALRAAEIDRLAPIRRRRLGYVLQQGGLLPFLTVRENIEIAGGSDDGAYARSLAERLGVSALLDRYPAQISIGQRQRVGIARALHSAPALILADEPTAALDPPTADETLDLFVETARERGAAVIMANHDWGAVERRGFARLAPQIGRGPYGTVVTFERAAA